MPIIMTCDVEDWLQAYTQQGDITFRCLDNIAIVLDLFDCLSIKATFFLQGMVARQYPQIVKLINNHGHDIQTHGFSHRPLHALTPQEFRNELIQSKKEIEQICGRKITGYRAPAFSVSSSTPWAYDILGELEFEFDSSVFPMKMRRYGIDNSPVQPFLINYKGGTLVEFPIAVGQWGPFKIPIGGGGYIRIFPLILLRYFWETASRHIMVIYVHPYEFNPHDFKGWERQIPLLFRMQQTYGRTTIIKKLKALLSGKECRTMSSCVSSIRKEALAQPSEPYVFPVK
jgi:polysaccharide deacetylase family protein (PEP-CTERM system associated)